MVSRPRLDEKRAPIMARSCLHSWLELGRKTMDVALYDSARTVSGTSRAASAVSFLARASRAAAGDETTTMVRVRPSRRDTTGP
uniref:Uncharacterized protein n=1 Tax=Arundo donax TaxID=35708 RepID=A0A0A9CHQ0_ARUDO